MPRPTVIEGLSDRKQALAANMSHRGESLDRILKYAELEDTITTRKAIQTLEDKLDQPMTNAIYAVNLELAQTDHLIGVALEKAEEGSTHHMGQYTKMSAHQLKIISQLDELEELEKARDRSWDPLFDTEAPEYRVFTAAVDTFLAMDTEVENDFSRLSEADQTRFLKIMSESA